MDLDNEMRCRSETRRLSTGDQSVRMAASRSGPQAAQQTIEQSAGSILPIHQSDSPLAWTRHSLEKLMMCFGVDPFEILGSVELIEDGAVGRLQHIADRFEPPKSVQGPAVRQVRH